MEADLGPRRGNYWAMTMSPARYVYGVFDVKRRDYRARCGDKFVRRVHGFQSMLPQLRANSSKKERPLGGKAAARGAPRIRILIGIRS